MYSSRYDEPATFKQRTALFNMLQALGRSTGNVHSISKREASKLIDELHKEIDKNGFPKREEVYE